MNIRILIIFFSLGCIIAGCKKITEPADYLEKVLFNIEQISSAAYYLTGEGYAPGDSIAYRTVHVYVKEFSNPADSFVGASFLKLSREDTTRLVSSWDGKRRLSAYHHRNGILIDSFKNDPRPFRVVDAPFFTKTKRLIQYAMTTGDSMSIAINDSDEFVQYSFYVYDTVVDIVGNRIVYSSIPFTMQKGEISKFTLWISKSNDLPYRFERDMPHDKSVQECSNVRFNIGDLASFNTIAYCPPDYEYREFIRGQGIISKITLEDQPAPDWILQDVDQNSFALGNLNSKVLMIQFTSVSCGPCRASVPFLNHLASEYDETDFDFVAIEAYNRNFRVLNSYKNRSKMIYKFLMSTNEVTTSYHIETVPTFFILDENRIVRHVIRGYRTGSTDLLIRESVDNLIL